MSDSEETVDMEEFIVEGVLMLGVSTAGVILNIFRWIEFPTKCLELCAQKTRSCLSQTDDLFYFFLYKSDLVSASEDRRSPIYSSVGIFYQLTEELY